MYAEITAAIQATKVIFDIVKANKGLANYNELVSAISEVNTKLMSATAIALSSQEKQSALSHRIRDLENELMGLKDWNHEAHRYILTELCPDVTVLTLKPGMDNGEPPHKLCATCFSQKQKGYLNQSGFDSHGTHYKCLNCDKEIVDYSHKKINPPRATRKHWMAQ